MPVRVTEVLNYFKEDWYVKWVHKIGLTEANRKSKEALKLGTILDEIVKGDGVLPTKAKPDTVFAHEAYMKWRAIYNPSYIRSCTRLNAMINGVEVTGEPDFEIPDTTIDLKGAVRISKHYKVQVNMYEHLRRLNGLTPNKNVAILRCDKETGSYEYWQEPFNTRFVDVWVGLMTAYVVYKEDEDGVDIREGQVEERVA